MTLKDMAAKLETEYKVHISFGDKMLKEMGQSEYDDCLGDNHAACAGDHIMLGRFDDDEVCLLSIFHEIGHTLLKWDWSEHYFTTYMKELMCWAIGIEEAMKHDIIFRDQTIKRQLATRLNTYSGRDERETLDFVKSYGNKYWKPFKENE